MNRKEFEDKFLEKCSEAVHKAYCSYYLKNKNKEYWTKGDYSLLDEPTKQIDRETVKAVFDVIWQQIKEAYLKGAEDLINGKHPDFPESETSKKLQAIAKELNSVQPDTDT